MAKTTFKIPMTDVIITARNKREELIAGIFVNKITFAAETAVEGKYTWALEVVDEFRGSSTSYVEDAAGYAGALYHLEMLEEPFVSGHIAKAIRELYLKMLTEQEACDECA